MRRIIQLLKIGAKLLISKIFSIFCLIFTQTFNTMKTFSLILIFIALGLVVFNITLLDFNQLFTQNNKVAFIGIIASFCAVLVLLIFRMSKIIEQKTKDQ